MCYIIAYSDYKRFGGGSGWHENWRCVLTLKATVLRAAVCTYTLVSYSFHNWEYSKQRKVQFLMTCTVAPDYFVGSVCGLIFPVVPFLLY